MTATRLTPFATSLGIRGVPLVSLAINTVNPTFLVDGDALRFRVILETELSAGDIERVGYSRVVGHLIDILPRHGNFRYGIAFWGEDDARTALSAIADLGVRLDDAARRFLTGVSEPA